MDIQGYHYLLYVKSKNYSMTFQNIFLANLGPSLSTKP